MSKKNGETPAPLKRIDAKSQYGFFQEGQGTPPKRKDDVKATSSVYAEQLKQEHGVKTPKESREEDKKKEADSGAAAAAKSGTKQPGAK